MRGASRGEERASQEREPRLSESHPERPFKPGRELKEKGGANGEELKERKRRRREKEEEEKEAIRDLSPFRFPEDLKVS